MRSIWARLALILLKHELMTWQLTASTAIAILPNVLRFSGRSFAGPWMSLTALWLFDSFEYWTIFSCRENWFVVVNASHSFLSADGKYEETLDAAMTQMAKNRRMLDDTGTEKWKSFFFSSALGRDLPGYSRAFIVCRTIDYLHREKGWPHCTEPIWWSSPKAAYNCSSDISPQDKPMLQDVPGI